MEDKGAAPLWPFCSFLSLCFPNVSTNLPVTSFRLAVLTPWVVEMRIDAVHLEKDFDDPPPRTPPYFLYVGYKLIWWSLCLTVPRLKAESFSALFVSLSVSPLHTEPPCRLKFIFYFSPFTFSIRRCTNRAELILLFMAYSHRPSRSTERKN